MITIDPHTTTMLRSVYPTLVDGYDVRVRSYLEVLAEVGLPMQTQLSGAVVVHDSCVYARYEDVVAEPRALLAAAGLVVNEPLNAGKLTWCCGGPVEALDPAKAAKVASDRAEQLRAAGTECVTMCPICLVNLRKAADGTLSIRDISEYLTDATRSAGVPTGIAR